MGKKPEHPSAQDREAFVFDLAAMQDRAHALGLWRTATAIAHAVLKAGGEIAGESSESHISI